MGSGRAYLVFKDLGFLANKLWTCILKRREVAETKMGL